MKPVTKKRANKKVLRELRRRPSITEGIEETYFVPVKPPEAWRECVDDKPAASPQTQEEDDAWAWWFDRKKGPYYSCDDDDYPDYDDDDWHHEVEGDEYGDALWQVAQRIDDERDRIKLLSESVQSPEQLLGAVMGIKMLSFNGSNFQRFRFEEQALGMVRDLLISLGYDKVVDYIEKTAKERIDKRSPF